MGKVEIRDDSDWCPSRSLSIAARTLVPFEVDPRFLSPPLPALSPSGFRLLESKALYGSATFQHRLWTPARRSIRWQTQSRFDYRSTHDISRTVRRAPLLELWLKISASDVSTPARPTPRGAISVFVEPAYLHTRLQGCANTRVMRPMNRGLFRAAGFVAGLSGTLVNR